MNFIRQIPHMFRRLPTTAFPEVMTMKMLRIGTVVCLITMLIAACGRGPGVDVAPLAGAPSPTSVAVGKPVDWNNPIRGQRVDSSDEARSNLSFQPQDPSGLGTPVSIFVTPTRSSDPQEKMSHNLAFVYDTSKYGRVAVLEEALRTSLAEFLDSIQTVVAGNDQPGISGHHEIVTIRGNAQALLSTLGDNSRSVIRWTEGGIVFLVEGPTLTRDSAVAIGNQI
jgi:hypothetical protein